MNNLKIKSATYQQLLADYQALQQYTAEIETLYIINKFADEETNLKNIFQFYLDSVSKLCQCRCGHLAIVANTPTSIMPNELQAADLWYVEKNLPPQLKVNLHAARQSLQTNSALAAQATRTVTTIYSANLMEASSAEWRAFLHAAELQHAIAIPVKQANKVIAVAEFFFTDQTHDFQRLRYLIDNITQQLTSTLIQQQTWSETKANYQKLLHAHFLTKQTVRLDDLTNLPNRSSFEEQLKVALNAPAQPTRMITVLIINLDQFKSLNKVYGYALGDLLLIEVAERLKNLLMATDFLARMSGDEFAMLLTRSLQHETIINFAQMILQQLTQTYQVEAATIEMSASIGIASCWHENNYNKELLKNAYLAMYAAKLAGRNTLQFFDAQIESKQGNYFNIINALHVALAKNEFFLEYQPIINLISNEIVEIEVLLRWHSAQFGLIPPEYFVPIAEEIGIMATIGQWVLQTAITDFMSWPIATCQYKLAINISAVQLRQENFVEELSSMLLRAKLPPQQLTLEITESIAPTYIEAARAKFLTLQQMGVTLAIDDFGTGHSSLTRLKSLPVQTLKIDKAFIKNINSDHSNALIIQSILALAKDLNLNVVVEGIETAAQVEFLKIHHCPCAQGFYFSAPLAAAKMLELLRNWPTL